MRSLVDDYTKKTSKIKQCLAHNSLRTGTDKNTFLVDLDYYTHNRSGSGKQDHFGDQGSSMMTDSMDYKGKIHNSVTLRALNNYEYNHNDNQDDQKEYFKFKMVNKPKMYRQIRPRKTNPFSSFCQESTTNDLTQENLRKSDVCTSSSVRSCQRYATPT